MPRRPLFDPSDWPIAWMARAERMHARNATALLAPYGLHHREFRLLALLGFAGSCSVAQLSEAAVLERPTVSKMLDRLQAEGWVKRVDDPNDLRRWALVLTPSGRAKLAATAPIVEGLFRSYQAGIPLRARTDFVRQVRAFYERVRRAGGHAEPEHPPGSQRHAKT